MNIQGDLEEKDALRLLRALRFARSNLGENEHVVVAEPEIGGVSMQLTVGIFLDHVLNRYKEYE